MEDKRATAPAILKKSTSAVYTVDEKIRNLEKKVEEYRDRLAAIEESIMDQFGESTEEYGVGPSEYTISWMPDNPPRVTPRDREIAIWRSRTRNEPTLYCDEELGTQ